MCIRDSNVVAPWFEIGESIDIDGKDTVIYELRKFMNLYLRMNPNILELLWVDYSDILFISAEYMMLRNERQNFLTSQIANTFVGYAEEQLKRMKGHSKWLTNPWPEECPHQVDYVSLVYNFTKQKMFKINLRDYNKDHCLVKFDGNLYGVYGLIGSKCFTGQHSKLHLSKLDPSFTNPDGSKESPKFIVKFNKTQYQEDKENWSNYWKWRRNRNPVRSKLEEHHGFDTKHASHCVRLLRMGLETLQTGEVLIKRPDAEELLSIRNGAWTYEQLLEYAAHMKAEVNEWYKKTDLRPTVDYDKAAILLTEIQTYFWDNQHD